ncbi:NADH-quinone oxidoreductase subunit D [uncultured Friedmanniella sp.]|uniref:NADH-quinone oxidoreductase subunit D-related protein n=1 Tax=uncultured Friedmanniella sp. TaxID=335381 RepID=UPI0035C95436
MHTPLRVLVGSLGRGVLPDAAVEPPAGTVLLDLGPDHPSTAGLLELALWTEEGVVSAASITVGAMHRGAEKLFEVRDYRQIGMLADRHDWQAPFSGELGVALVGEQLLGLEVPVRARWLRTLLAEHTRILSHLGFLSHLATGPARLAEVRTARERLRDQTLRLTGNRIHPMVARIGGLATDADDGWLRQEHEEMGAVAALGRRLAATVDETAGLAGVAVLGREVAAGYGVSGTAARASGLALDLRSSTPGLAYGELVGLIAPAPTEAGDAAARFATFAHEVVESSSLVRACVERLTGLPGPVAVPLGKVVRLPEGEGYLALEAPLGLAGFYVVSRGEKTPWRFKLRTPSFSNVAALESVLVGVPVASLEVALASIGYVVGDIDR